MTSNPTTPYQPMTPPLTRGERIADFLVMGVLIFWFSFMGLTPQKITRVPQKGRPADQPKRPLNIEDDSQDILGVAAE